MNHRHLLPEEFDLMLDDEGGFGAVALKPRLDECAECQNRAADLRRMGELLEHLPYFAPSHEFANRVMSQVPVFVPWYVTAGDTFAKWVPRSRSARVVALSLAGLAASMLTVVILWVATRPDLIVFATDVAGSQLRESLVRGGSDVVLALFGDQALTMILQAGTTGLIVVGIVLLGATLASLAGLRAIAAAAGRRRA